MLHQADDKSCPIVDDPNNYHFEGRCEDCDVSHMSRMPLGEVEDRYRIGRISQDGFEAYTYVWKLLYPYSSSPNDVAAPSIPAVRRIARKLLLARDFAVPADLAAARR